ncbi:MAG: Mrp/NBP35 family ATP-binding protein [Pseudomonadota bacterium]
MFSIFGRQEKDQGVSASKASKNNENVIESIHKALQGVHDPVSGRDIVSAGRIQGFSLVDGAVTFALEVDPAEADRAEPLRAAAEQAAGNAEGVKTARVVLTAHKSGQSAAKPPSPPRPGGGVQPLEIPGVKDVIAVASGKGGVGKSTIAANLALALAQRGLNVGFLDADVYGPSAPTMFGLSERPNMGEAGKLRPHEKFGLKIMSMGFMVEGSEAMIWRGPIVTSAIQQMLKDVDWGSLDVLIVDMPPGTGDAHLTLVQRAPLSGAVIVSTPQEMALADARRGLAMFEKTKAPILGLVENMAYFVSPGSNEKIHIFGEGGARRTAAETGAPFLGEMPLYPELRAAADAGVPIVAAAPDSAPAQRFFDLAEGVLAAIAAAKEVRPAPKIVIED